MPAPLRPIIPGDWMGLEQVIKDLWAIVNADTSLSDMIVDVTAVSDALSTEISDRQSAIKYISDELSDAVSDIVTVASDLKLVSDALILAGSSSDLTVISDALSSAVSDVNTNTSDLKFVSDEVLAVSDALVIVTSDLALLDDCPTHKYIAATGQASATDLHLSDGTNWNVSKAQIKYIRIVTASTDWDLYILQNDNGYVADDATIPMMKIADSISGNANLWLDLPYEDEDASGEVHLYFLDNGGAETASIYIKAFALT